MAMQVVIRVRGRVQGVGYRAFIADAAGRLGLSGYVRNNRDGTVGILAVGEDDAVHALIEAANTGPPTAKVERVEVENQPVEGGFAGFRVRY